MLKQVSHFHLIGQCPLVCFQTTEQSIKQQRQNCQWHKRILYAWPAAGQFLTKSHCTKQVYIGKLELSQASMNHSNCVAIPFSTVQNSRCTAIATHPRTPTNMIARLITCVIYSTVGRSIANIYNPRRHIYQGTKLQGKYTAEVIYRGYKSTYCITYNIRNVYVI